MAMAADAQREQLHALKRQWQTFGIVNPTINLIIERVEQEQQYGFLDTLDEVIAWCSPQIRPRRNCYYAKIITSYDKQYGLTQEMLRSAYMDMVCVFADNNKSAVEVMRMLSNYRMNPLGYEEFIQWLVDRQDLRDFLNNKWRTGDFAWFGNEPLGQGIVIDQEVIDRVHMMAIAIRALPDLYQADQALYEGQITEMYIHAFGDGNRLQPISDDAAVSIALLYDLTRNNQANEAVQELIRPLYRAFTEYTTGMNSVENYQEVIESRCTLILGGPHRPVSPDPDDMIDEDAPAQFYAL